MFLREDGDLFPEKKSASKIDRASRDYRNHTRLANCAARALLDTIECNTHVEQRCNRVIRRIVKKI